MKRLAGLLVVVGLISVVGLVAGCNGHHSSTEPSSPPIISNLKTLSFERFDANTGELPLSFDYVDRDGDVSQVRVTFASGTAANPAQGVAGHTTGSISILQAVVLPDPTSHQLAFSVQVEDARGNLSNTLSGQVAIP